MFRPPTQPKKEWLLHDGAPATAHTNRHGKVVDIRPATTTYVVRHDGPHCILHRAKGVEGWRDGQEIIGIYRNVQYLYPQNTVVTASFTIPDTKLTWRWSFEVAAFHDIAGFPRPADQAAALKATLLAQSNSLVSMHVNTERATEAFRFMVRSWLQYRYSRKLISRYARTGRNHAGLIHLIRRECDTDAALYYAILNLNLREIIWDMD
jgi:hypothetical protein